MKALLSATVIKHFLILRQAVISSWHRFKRILDIENLQLIILPKLLRL